MLPVCPDVSACLLEVLGLWVSLVKSFGPSSAGTLLVHFGSFYLPCSLIEEVSAERGMPAEGETVIKVTEMMPPGWGDVVQQAHN